jgi:GT2 family glycosyltransferase
VREKFPNIKIIENNINNYSKAINLGIKNSRGQYIAVLNNDTVVEKNWLKALMEIIDQDEKIGVVQSKILFSDKQNINSAGVEETKDFHFRDIGFGEKDIGKYNEIREIYYFTGVSVLLKRKCVEAVGEFDEDFLMYMEDIDYSIRCRDLGWKIFYSPNSVVYHRCHGSASPELCEYFRSRNRLLLLANIFQKNWQDALRSPIFILRERMKIYIAR